MTSEWQAVLEWNQQIKGLDQLCQRVEQLALKQDKQLEAMNDMKAMLARLVGW